MSSRVIYFEIHADDTARAQKFYGGLFGWQFMKFEDMEYWTIETGPESDPGINGGLMKRPGAAEGDCATAFVCTIGVPDIDTHSKKALSLGAEVAHEKTAVPGMGWAAYFKDPEGNTFGMFQMDPEAK